MYLCVFVLEANTHQIHNQIQQQAAVHVAVHVAVKNSRDSQSATMPPQRVANPNPTRVQLRVQNAGWSPDVERWESDEDSEDSGDEREADEQEVALSEAAILRLMA